MGGADNVDASTPGPPQDPVLGVRTPAFRRLWWSWTVSLLGDGVRGLALPLYVAVQTHSPLAASAVTASEVLPWLLCALPAGAIVDRSRPTVVLTTAHALRAVVTAGVVMAIIYNFATVPILCIFAFVLTVAETFAYSASQALMVSLAGPEQLNEANAKFYTVHTIGLNLAGPLAAGALFTIDPAWTFTLDGLTFLIAAVLIAGLPAPAPTAAPSAKDRRRLTSEIRDGVTLLFRINGLRVLVSMIAAATLAISAVNALTPLYAIRELDMPPGWVSTLLVVGALGALLGTRAAVPAARRWSEGNIMVASMATMAAGMILFGAFPLVPTALAANVVLGVGVGGWNVLAAARRQRLTPSNAMGRISGAYRMLAWGLMPVGAGLAGPLAVATSLGTVFVIVGGFILAVLMVLTRSLLRTGAQAPVSPQRTNKPSRSAVPSVPPVPPVPPVAPVPPVPPVPARTPRQSRRADSSN
jgi:MFS family permease